MAKVVLISPPEKHLLMEAGDRPNMGLLYMAGALQRAGHEPVICDLNHDSYNVMNRHLDNTQYVGITTMTPYFNWFMNLAAHIKQNRPGLTLIAGGPHATVRPRELVGRFDYVVKGEGERAIVKIVEGQYTQQIVSEPYEENMDSLPFPFGLLDTERYGLNQEGHRTMTMLTSRSCNYDCFFCTKDILGKHQRKHSVDRVMQEVNALKTFGYDSIYFLDDCFTSDMERAKQIAERLRGRGISFRVGTRVDKVNPKLLEALVDGGMRSISFGLEHMDNEVLWRTRKRNSVSQNVTAVQQAHDAGLKVRGSFIVNLPGANRETNMRTLDFAIKEKLEFADFYPLVAYPGTPLWETPDKFGVEIISKDYMAHQTSTKSNVNNGLMNEEEVSDLVREIRSKWAQFKGLQCPWEAERGK